MLLWSRVTPFQKARLMLDAYPAHADFFQLLHLLAVPHSHQVSFATLSCQAPHAAPADRP